MVEKGFYKPTPRRIVKQDSDFAQSPISSKIHNILLHPQAGVAVFRSLTDVASTLLINQLSIPPLDKSLSLQYCSILKASKACAVSQHSHGHPPPAGNHSSWSSAMVL